MFYQQASWDKHTTLLEGSVFLYSIVNLQAMEPLGGSTSLPKRSQENRKGPAPLASFDEVSVYSLDISSPDRGKRKCKNNEL